jgi:hypothetical protein
MCLRTISEEKPNETGEFYKLFTMLESGVLAPWIYPNSLPIRRGVWLKAEKREILTFYEVYYMSGFHGFVAESDAWRFSCNRADRVVKCQYRGGRLLGMQHDGVTVVADEMFVPKEG